MMTLFSFLKKIQSIQPVHLYFDMQGYSEDL